MRAHITASAADTTVVPLPPFTDQQTNMTYPQESGDCDWGKSWPTISPSPCRSNVVGDSVLSVIVAVVQVGEVLVRVGQLEVAMPLLAQHLDGIGCVVWVRRVDRVRVLESHVMVLVPVA